MEGRVNHWGLVIAGIGFFATRFTVTLAIYEDPVRFYFAGVVPLVLGLGLAAFGVALAIGDVDGALVRTTALWCIVGAATMLVLVVLTLLGSTPGRMLDLATIRSRTYLSNFLIGGSVGGTMTGLYAAGNRRQRDELQRQAQRLEVLNRLLRHEVLNAVSVIKGYASHTGATDADARAVIEERSNAIGRTIEEVKHLTRGVGAGRSPSGSVDVEACIERSVEAVTDRYPEATIAVERPEQDLAVRADDRLDRVIVNLLENAVTHAADEEPRATVSVASTAAVVRVSVSDEGPGLPASQRRLLEKGEIQEFDDPSSGFGLNIVRLLVDEYGGTIETAVDDSGSTVTVVLPRSEGRNLGFEPGGSSLVGVRPATPHLVVVLGAAVIAGVPYGVVAEWLGGSIAAIGVFYGIQDPVVGWLTHEFHSVVFGFAFGGLASLLPRRYRDRPWAYVAVGVGWAVCLWLFAAGVIAPAWLRLLGIPSPIPTFSPEILASHLAWGVSLGALTAGGYAYVVPWLVRLDERLARVRWLGA